MTKLWSAQIDVSGIPTKIPASKRITNNKPKSAKCVPRDAFGPIKENVPEKIYDNGMMLRSICTNAEWMKAMSNALAKDLISAVEMEALLSKQQKEVLNLDEIIMMFRWYFNIDRCNDSSIETFAARVKQQTDILPKGICLYSYSIQL